MPEEASSTPWWVWVIVSVGVVLLGICGYGGYLLYQLRNYDPTYHYRTGDEPPPCLPGAYSDVIGKCPRCEGAPSTACLYPDLCIDPVRQCLQLGACLEMRPQQISLCESR